MNKYRVAHFMAHGVNYEGNTLWTTFIIKFGAWTLSSTFGGLCCPFPTYSRPWRCRC